MTLLVILDSHDTVYLTGEIIEFELYIEQEKEVTVEL